MSLKHTLIFTALMSTFNLQAKAYDCIEVNVFNVDRENITTRKLARAAEMPDQVLQSIQTYVKTELGVDKNGLTAKKGGDDTCESSKSALELKGLITDYKKGSRIMRYVVGLGAGKQKIEVVAELYDKGTGDLLKRGRVVDRKIGGWVGGSENKGKRDFAEKINNFVRTALGMKKSKL